MSSQSLSSRYDIFQREAVLNIVSDYRAKPSGRYLLVIPTAGGKTMTAVKSLNQLFADNILSPEDDKILWVAHRDELIGQAKDTYTKFRKYYPEAPSFFNRVVFSMISQAENHLNDDASIKLVVIDEAHHGAANSYLPLFGKAHVGVLGLTATPTRHDGKALEFERESYSIGFPDLVDLGVIVRPHVRKISSQKLDITGIGTTEELEQLNFRARNERIVQALLKGRDEYQKVVIFVGTTKHAKDLYSMLKGSALAKHYDSIGYIVGGTTANSRSEPRTEFLKKEKNWKRSILINVAVLTEGYDDPSINTVIMAVPTRSKLIYMQAIGRAVRLDPNDELKKAYILEMDEELPNIKYRIDNRWLYSDISDALEPAVVDYDFSTEFEFHSVLEEVYDEYSVPAEYREKPVFNLGNRYSLLLFKVYTNQNDYKHQPILVTNDNRLDVSNFFNYLSERMPSLMLKGVNREEAMLMAGFQKLSSLDDQTVRMRIIDAMKNSLDPSEHTVKEMAWVTFVAFRLKRSADDLSKELEEFLESLINREDIRDSILQRAYPDKASLVRLPLPLGGYIGRFLTEEELEQVKVVLGDLEDVKLKYANADHRKEVRNVLDDAVFPLEIGYVISLLLISRENTAYCIGLE